MKKYPVHQLLLISGVQFSSGMLQISIRKLYLLIMKLPDSIYHAFPAALIIDHSICGSVINLCLCDFL